MVSGGMDAPASGYQRGWYPPPTVFCLSHLWHMEYNFEVLGSCWGSIWTHLVVELLMMTQSVQRLYLNYQGYHSFTDCII